MSELLTAVVAFALGWFAARRRYRPKPVSPATDRQREYIASLLVERQGGIELLDGSALNPDDPEFTVGSASILIDALKSLPRK